jgi:hypothetical protein
MTPAEFAWALVAGHGRALQYIKEHGDSRPEIRAALMNACTSCPSIDPQVDPRWRWVAEMILHTASPDDYLSEIHRQAPPRFKLVPVTSFLYPRTSLTRITISRFQVWRQ